MQVERLLDIAGGQSCVAYPASLGMKESFGRSEMAFPDNDHLDHRVETVP